MDSPKYQVCRPLTPIEYEVLKADIAARGVQVPVEVDENGDVLDGHHRVKIWQELNAAGAGLPDYPIIMRRGMTEDEKLDHANALNAARRQMTEDEVIRRMKQLRSRGMSYRAIAAEVGVDKMTVQRQTSGVSIDTPVRGLDGKEYPATRQSNGNGMMTLESSIPMPLPDLALVQELRQKMEDDGRHVFTCPDCGDIFDQYVWHCPNCHHHWLDGRDYCANCYDKRPGAPVEDDEPEPLAPVPMAVHFSSETPEHYTPAHVLDAVTECMGGIDLDPCADPGHSVPAAAHYTAADDGLAQTWAGCVYMNPPYGREIDAWVSKLVQEYEAGNVTQAIALVPARTDTQWWQRLRDYHICFVTGRLTFIGNSDPAPFPSAVVYLGSEVDAFVNTFEPLGDIWHRTRRGYCFGE